MLLGVFAFGFTIKKIGLTTQTQSDLLIINFITLPGFIVGGLLSEAKFIGRKFSVILGLAFYVIFITLFLIFPKQVKLFYGMATFTTPIFYFILVNYTSEAYNSNIRDLSLGFLLFIGKFGAFGSKYLLIFLERELPG